MTGWFLNWLVYSVDWKLWVFIGLIVVASVLRFFGWRWALAIGATIGAAVLLNRQGQIGYKARIKQEKDAADAQQAHWDAIDSQPLAPDDAYQQLRDRAAKAGK